MAAAQPGVRGARCALQLVRHVAVARQVIAVGEALLEQDVHDPQASAPSVPGRSARCMSACSAVAVR